jgi:epsilon-lactone hydrolase
MAHEIDAIRQMLSSAPRPVGWPARRARMDQVCAVDGLPDGVTFDPLTVAGCPAEWSNVPGGREDRAVLFLHGGGYCSGSIVSHRTMAGGIARAAGLRVLALGYRLAPEHPFPAALDDALAAWDWLIAQGLAPGRFALAGDSAGGGLALAMMQRLRARGQALPGAAVLFSPWTDLTMTGASMIDADPEDPLIHRGYLQGLAEAYLAGHDPRDPLVSPLFADLSGFPPVFIGAGSDETLLDDSTRLARALAVAQVSVTLSVYPWMIHAFPLWAAQLTEGRRALAEAGAFLQGRLG